MLAENKDYIEKEAVFISTLIVRELVSNFGKDKEEAVQLVETSNIKDSIMKNPTLLHDSPEKWAIYVLTTHNDVEAIERYYSE